jgi:hypothetical protein
MIVTPLPGYLKLFNPMMIGPEAPPPGGFQSEVGRVSEQIQQDDNYRQGEGAVYLESATNRHSESKLPRESEVDRANQMKMRV